MPILGRYILRTVFAYTGLTLVVLLALGALFLFMAEQDDIGTGSYTASQAMVFVLLTMPTYTSQLLPVAALIGGLLGLGNLARGSELVVMRASGITTLQFCGWLVIAGATLALLMLGLGEFVAPPLEKYARQVKVFSKYDEFSFAGKRGTWVRDGDSIFGVEQQSAESRFGGVQIFRFDEQRRLVSVGRAASASVDSDNRWRLEDYRETRFGPDGTTVSKESVAEIRSALSPDFLGLAVTEPDSMGLRGLATYVEHLRRNDLDSARFEIALWSRVARIVALLLVLVLALPFALGPLRSTGQGARTVVGIMIGAGFVLLSQTLENSGQLFGLSPLVTAWAPTALLAMLTFGMLTRAR